MKSKSPALQINYKEIPYKRLQILLYDTANEECLHRMVVAHANNIPRYILMAAFGLFKMQVKEML